MSTNKKKQSTNRQTSASADPEDICSFSQEAEQNFSKDGQNAAPSIPVHKWMLQMLISNPQEIQDQSSKFKKILPPSKTIFSGINPEAIIQLNFGSMLEGVQFNQKKCQQMQQTNDFEEIIFNFQGIQQEAKFPIKSKDFVYKTPEKQKKSDLQKAQIEEKLLWAPKKKTTRSKIKK